MYANKADMNTACKDEGWEMRSEGGPLSFVHKDTGKPVDWSKAEPMAAMAVLFYLSRHGGNGELCREIERALRSFIQS